MKFFSKLLAGAVLCLPLVASAQYGIGGFVQPVNVKSAFQNYSIPGSGTNAFAVGAGAPFVTNVFNASTNNVPLSWATPLVVGANGFGVHYYGNMGAAASTNVLVFEASGDGVTYLTTPTIDIWVTGTGAKVLYTNVPNTIANLGNLATIRLKYITNHASASTASITNITITTR